MSRFEIRLSGSGGQGMITAGIILANAAAIYENKNSVQSQSYGPEARGGASKAEVIISSDEINYPKVTSPDFLVALTQEAYDKYSKDIKDDCLIIIDSAFVKEYDINNKNIYPMAITETVLEKLGKELGSNIATIAAANYIGKFVNEDSLLKSVLSMIPKGTEDFNKKAFNIGLDLAKNIVG